jgi:hypothetical protein
MAAQNFPLAETHAILLHETETNQDKNVAALLREP